MTHTVKECCTHHLRTLTCRKKHCESIGIETIKIWKVENKPVFLGEPLV